MVISNNNKIIVIVVALLLSAILAWFFIFSTKTDDHVLVSDGVQLPKGNYPNERVIERVYTVKNTTRRNQSAKIVLHAPVMHTSSQWLISLDVSVPHLQRKGESGNQQLVFDFKDLPPDAKFQIRMSAKLATSGKPNELLEHDRERYLVSDIFIETDNKEIAHLAGKLKQDVPLKTSKKISGWIKDNIAMPAEDKPILDSAAEHAELKSSISSGALETLRKKSGTEWDRVLLFVAVSRAAGVMARPVVGYRNVNSHPIISAWAEIYDADRWRIVDPVRAVVDDDGEDYITFRIFHSVPNMHIQQLRDLLLEYYGVVIEEQM